MEETTNKPNHLVLEHELGPLKRLVFAEALPYSPYGKVEKLKLRELYLPKP